MGIFVDVATEQLGYLLEEVSYLKGKANNIIEFCETPILHNMQLNDTDKIKLKRIIDRAETVSGMLTKFGDVLRVNNKLRGNQYEER